MGNKIRSHSQGQDDKRFALHLEKASLVVSQWPAWKQSVLGRTDTDKANSSKASTEENGDTKGTVTM